MSVPHSGLSVILQFHRVMINSLTCRPCIKLAESGCIDVVSDRIFRSVFQFMVYSFACLYLVFSRLH